MRITASKLRQDVYRILDEAIATGIPVEVMRKGTILRIVPDKRASKLARLRKRSGFEGDPDEINFACHCAVGWIVGVGKPGAKGKRAVLCGVARDKPQCLALGSRGDPA